MKITKSVVTAMLATASVGLAAGTATAAPPQPQPVSAPRTPAAQPRAVNGPQTPVMARWTSQGMRYETRAVPGSAGVRTTVDVGSFAVTRGGSRITLSDSRGTVIASAPTTVSVSGHPVSFVAAVAPGGKTLTLTPIDYWATDVQHPSLAEVAGGMIGGVIGLQLGAGLGAILGMLAGLPFFLVGAFPGLFIGAIAGAVAGAAGGAVAGFDLGGSIH